MDAAELETILVNLSLDGGEGVQVGAVRGFPVLEIDGRTMYAVPRTVLAPEGGYVRRFRPKSGVAFMVADEDGVVCSSIGGCAVRTDHNEITLDVFMERYGDLFARNSLDLRSPRGPFDSLLAALG